MFFSFWVDLFLWVNNWFISLLPPPLLPQQPSHDPPLTTRFSNHYHSTEIVRILFLFHSRQLCPLRHGNALADPSEVYQLVFDPPCTEGWGQGGSHSVMQSSSPGACGHGPPKGAPCDGGPPAYHIRNFESRNKHQK